MPVNPHLLKHLHMRGRGLSGPTLVGGGLWDSIKTGATSAGSSLWGLGKRGFGAVAPVLMDAGRNALAGGSNALLSGLLSGDGVKNSLRAGLSAAQGSVDRGALRDSLLGAAMGPRPVF